MFVAVVPPAQLVEHLDELLAARRGAGAFRRGKRLPVTSLTAVDA